MKPTPHAFTVRDLVGGNLVLDFLNTVTARDQPVPSDWLHDYDALLDWAALTGQFTGRDLRTLRAQASLQPRLAAKALTRARELREALYAGANLAIRHRALPEALVDDLKSQWQRTLDHATYGTRYGHWTIVHSADTSGLELVSHVVAFAALHWLPRIDAERVRTCPAPSCGWMFLDTSKAGRRRWCDMATCGNRAKARRHKRKLR